MRRALVVIGYQKEKLEECGRRAYKNLTDWIMGFQGDYDCTIVVNRKPSRFIQRAGVECIEDGVSRNYPFCVDREISVSGYDVDTDEFTRDMEYHLVGVSTGASIICMSMSMFSAGLNIKVLTDHCYDRKGLDKEAVKIMKAYMGDRVI